MQITKYVHSCVLVETEERVGLFDPGSYSWDSGIFRIEAIERIDRIVITHEHSDHCHPPFIQAVLERFPQAHIVCNESVQRVLEGAGISATFRGDQTACTRPFEAPHEKLPMLSVEPPKNTGFHFVGLFTHPGDSHHFSETKTVLALPVTAPWGSTTAAVELAVRLKPKYVLPIHDWHYKDAARLRLHESIETELTNYGISMLRPTDGSAISLDI